MLTKLVISCVEKRRGVLERLEHVMTLASQRLHFEQAMRWREDLRVLTWLTRRLEEHERARHELTCVYPIESDDGRSHWYLIRRGVVEHAIRAPKSARDRKRAEREVSQWLSQDNHVGVQYQRREETLAIVSGWFRKFPDQRKTLQRLQASA